MLLKFNIENRLDHGYGAKRNVYAVLIKDLNKFDEEIGFNLKRKENKLKSLKSNI